MTTTAKYELFAMRTDFHNALIRKFALGAPVSESMVKASWHRLCDAKNDYIETYYGIGA